jgi:hypothetical protein
MSKVWSLLFNNKGQMIVIFLMIAAAVIMLVYTVVSLLKNESKWSIKSQKGITAQHICDGALDRVIWKLQQGDNWDNATSLSGYTWSDTHSDIAGGTYILKIETGDQIVTPGDTDTERTVTIQATASVTNEIRKIMVVLSKSPFNYGMITGGTAAIGGSAEIYWSDAICYSTTSPALTLGNTLTLGSDRTKYYALGTIKYGNDFYPPNTSSYLFPNQTVPPLPEKPVVNFSWFKSQAQLTGTYFGSGVTHSFDDGSGDHNSGGDHYPPTEDCLANAASGQLSDNLVIFVDTTDGDENSYTHAEAYNGDGGGTNTNDWIDLKGKYLQGSLIVMGPVYCSGNGGGSLTLTPPSNGYYPQTTQNLTKVVHNGFLYCAGNFKAVGTPEFYGTVMVDPGEVLDSGNMKLYWREDLSSNGVIGRTISIKRWKSVAN